MPVLGRRTVRTRGTLSKIMKVPGCGALRVLSLAKDAHWSMTFDNALVQSSRRSSRRQHIAAQRQRDAERAAAEHAQTTPKHRAQEQQAEVERLVALSRWRGELLQKLRALQRRPQRSAALAATCRLSAIHATQDTPDPMQHFCASGKKLRDAFKRDPVVAELVNKPIMQVSSWPVKERARMVRDFFKRAGVNAPVGIDVRDSQQNNGDAGKGGFLADKITRKAGTVLALILPDIMGINEPSLCMGMPWKDGVQREFGQLLGGLFNTKLLPTDEEINAAIYTIGATNNPGVSFAAVISTKPIQPGDEIVVQYDNKAPARNTSQ